MSVFAADEGAMSTKVYHGVNLLILVNIYHHHQKSFQYQYSFSSVCECHPTLTHALRPNVQGLTPVAFVLSPSPLNLPVDLALGFALPLHGHIGMNYVITDYATKVFGSGARDPARAAMFAFTGITMFGLTSLNLNGPGITTTVKSLWYSKQ